MFDTLKYVTMLETVGFTRDQAEISIKILDEIMEDKLATKNDIHELRTSMKSSFIQFESKFDNELKILRLEISQMESKLTIRMGTMLAASIAVLTAIQKLI